MSDCILTADRPLAGYERAIGNITLTAPADLAIVSVALPRGGEAAAEKAVAAAFAVAVPDIGTAALAPDHDTALLRLARDQLFVLFTHAAPDAERAVAARLNGAAYTTDQSDVWCALDVSGPGCRRALERICPLDLHPDAFATGDAARTVMEHLGVIILRTAEDGFRLLSASSSAGSFLHALETSAENVL